MPTPTPPRLDVLIESEYTVKHARGVAGITGRLHMGKSGQRLCRAALAPSGLGLSLLMEMATSGCGGHAIARNTPDASPDDEVIEGTKITIRSYPYGHLPGESPFNTSLVAFRDGDGPWRALTGHDGVYVAGTTAERYGVVTVCVESVSQPIFNFVNVYYEAATDTTEIDAPGCVVNGPPVKASYVNVSVDVHGLQDGEQASVAVGSQQFQSAPGPSHLDFTIPRGTPAEVFVAADVPADSMQIARQFIRGPVLAALQDQSLSYDLAAAGSPPELHDFTLMNGPASGLGIESYYAPASSQAAWLLGVDFRPAIRPPYQYATLSAAARHQGDLADIYVSAVSPPSDGSFVSRSVRQAIQPATVPALELPPPWTAAPPVLSDVPAGATVTLPITPTILRTVSYTVYLGAVLPIPVGYDQHQWTLHIGAGWAGSKASVTVSTPDPAGVTGWTPGMSFPAHPDVSWSIVRGEDDGTELAPTVGRRRFSNTVSGDIPAL